MRGQPYKSHINMKNGVNLKCRVSTCSFCKSNSVLSAGAGLPASAALFLPAQDLQNAHFRTTVNIDKFINWSLKCHLQNASMATETQTKILLGKADKYFKK